VRRPRALSVTQEALSVTQRYVNVTQRALNVTQQLTHLLCDCRVPGRLLLSEGVSKASASSAASCSQGLGFHVSELAGRAAVAGELRPLRSCCASMYSSVCVPVHACQRTARIVWSAQAREVQHNGIIIIIIIIIANRGLARVRQKMAVEREANHNTFAAYV
jgi:hypothetical protein